MITKVPPLSVVMKSGGAGDAAKVKGAGVVPPLVTPPLVGLTVIDVTLPITVAVAVPLRACADAVIVAVPATAPNAAPLLGSANVTFPLLLDQETPLVICFLVPSS